MLKKAFPQIQIEMVKEKKFEESRVSTEVVASDRKLLNAYVEKNNRNDLDPERLLSFGLEVLLDADHPS